MCVFAPEENDFSSPNTKARKIKFNRRVRVPRRMASVPQSMMMAKSRRKKLEKEIFEQANSQPAKYNTKMMNSIWGQYNRYSVHNLKSTQGEDGLLADSPVVQIIQEHYDQIERATSPVIALLKGRQKQLERSRSPLRRVQLEMQDERSRSPSLSEYSDDERCHSPMSFIVEDHMKQTLHAESPLLSLAVENPQAKATSSSPFQRFEREAKEQADRCCSPFQSMMLDYPNPASTIFLPH